jgi:Mg-chelatase subunit ChlD
MKSRILVLGLAVATVATVLAYPSLSSYATGNNANALTPAQRRAPQTSAKVEVVFVLDTTGSMGGLIAAAKEKIWSIATTLAQANEAPEISMGLVAYRDRGDTYVTQVVDLSNDLDSMYGTLMDFAADGGGDDPESVNEALYDAVHKISWTQDPASYKVVFLVGDAPPHMDYPGDVKYPDILAAAEAKGIVVNTIQCGSMPQTVAPWQRIAALGHGRYFTVEQSGSALAIASPYDAEIAKLAAELDRTRMYYGTAEDLAARAPKIEATAKLHSEASVAAQARRGVYNSTAGGAANSFGEGELIADIASGRVDLAAVPAAELPEPLIGLSKEEQRTLIEETAAERKALQSRIAALADERDAFLKDQVEKRGGATGSLDQQIYDAVREQAAGRGLRYEGGPKL